MRGFREYLHPPFLSKLLQTKDRQQALIYFNICNCRIKDKTNVETTVNIVCPNKVEIITNKNKKKWERKWEEEYTDSLAYSIWSKRISFKDDILNNICINISQYKGKF